MPSPLVTTGDPTDPVAGALGHPGTRVLFGGGDLDYGRAPGFRLTLGGWFGDEPVGGEVSAFWLDSRTVNFATRSDAAGSPPVYLPVFNLATGREGSIVVSDPVFGVGGQPARPQPVPACGGRRPTPWRPSAAGRSSSPSWPGSGTWT